MEEEEPKSKVRRVEKDRAKDTVWALSRWGQRWVILV